MELDIVHIANTGSWAAVNSLNPIFDDFFTPIGDNSRYFACNVDPKEKSLEASNRMNEAAN